MKFPMYMIVGFKEGCTSNVSIIHLGHWSKPTYIMYRIYYDPYYSSSTHINCVVIIGWPIRLGIIWHLVLHEDRFNWHATLMLMAH